MRPQPRLKVETGQDVAQKCPKWSRIIIGDKICLPSHVGLSEQCLRSLQTRTSSSRCNSVGSVVHGQRSMKIAMRCVAMQQVLITGAALQAT